MEQMRTFDFVSFEHDVQTGLGYAIQDMISNWLGTTGYGTTTVPGVVAGLAATQTTTPSLTINIAAGRIYALSANDATADGAITQDTTLALQQGTNPGQTVTLVPPAGGQSQWNLVQGQFQQNDSVRTGDPNGGLVPFYNSANPSVPIYTSINTVRRGQLVLQVVQGAAATTGSEAPPSATSGWVPLYLIDLAGGQSAITTGQILTAGPSVGTNVPNNYAYAPFLAGMLASHHGGYAGQAPKVRLGSEVQGTLPYANMSPVRTLLTANTTFYVNTTTGNDSTGNGTSGAPWQTVAHMDSVLATQYDFGGYQVTVNINGNTQFFGNVYTPVTYSWAAPPYSDYVLGIGERVTATFSAATSIPLRIATAQGVYKITLVVTSNNTTDSNWNLRPNNTTYTGAFSSYGVECCDGEMIAFGTATTPPTYTAKTATPYIAGVPATYTSVSQNAFFFDTLSGPTGSDPVNGIGPSMHEIVVSTTTTAKFCKHSSAIKGSAAIASGWWADTTTAWSSLGTLVDINSTSFSGTVIVERLA